MASARFRPNKRARLAADPLATAANDGALPTELLFDILLRLPVKVLCRLRLVCRAWRALTSDPGFARAHASRRPLVVAGLSKHRGDIKFVDLSGDVVKLMPIEVERVRSGHGVSTQPDHVCISASGGKACVINTATGAVTNLAGMHKLVRSTSVLGLVPSTGEYKVLRTHNYETCDVMTLNGGDGRWRKRPSPPMIISASFERRVVIHGVAYFLNTCDRRSTVQSDNIASFDFTTEKWRPTTFQGPLSSLLPGVDKKHLEGDLQLAELNGCLVTVHCNDKDCSIDLWFLVDVNEGIWTKKYSLQCSPDWKSPENMLYPLVILDDERIVLWGQRDQVLRAYNLRTTTWDELAVVKDYFCVGMLRGSLLCSGLVSNKVVPDAAVASSTRTQEEGGKLKRSLRARRSNTLVTGPDWV